MLYNHPQSSYYESFLSFFFELLTFTSCQPISNVLSSNYNSNLEITKISWYSEDYINMLLKHYLAQEYYIAAQSHLGHESLIEVNVIAAIKAVTDKVKISVLTIQIHGNHSVVAVFREHFTMEKVLQVIYNDPMGIALSNESSNSFNFLDTFVQQS